MAIYFNYLFGFILNGSFSFSSDEELEDESDAVPVAIRWVSFLNILNI